MINLQMFRVNSSFLEVLATRPEALSYLNMQSESENQIIGFLNVYIQGRNLKYMEAANEVLNQAPVKNV